MSDPSIQSTPRPATRSILPSRFPPPSRPRPRWSAVGRRGRPCSSSSSSSSSTCSASASSCRCCRATAASTSARSSTQDGAEQHDWRVGAVVGALIAVFSLMQFLFAPCGAASPIASDGGPFCLLAWQDRWFSTRCLVTPPTFHLPRWPFWRWCCCSSRARGRRGGGDDRHGPGGRRRLYDAGAAQARHGPDRHGLRRRLRLRPAGRCRLPCMGRPTSKASSVTSRPACR